MTKKRLVLTWEDVDAGSGVSTSTVALPGNTFSQSTTQSYMVDHPKLSKPIPAVVDLWKEYSTGLAGRMAISEANRRFGSKWRKDSSEARFYLRHKKYYETMEAIAAIAIISTKQAAKGLALARPRGK
ncbi:hypothetical protein PC129_g23361 [Phytophthora cactorum]|nr:hypothetical protein Pcac1_g9130 [Phytophthora cactorum]KAG2781163.1 hypothetical protein Pcac1_g9132 [Phytophthora cactorum]KAG2792817.1 hypothetical protein PC111_g23302 [Phytophthora cactorum]KAG2793103.1 hypothetical protein PC112_g23586 [Phytophthora cactorum]KAG2813621.1 hypothetical protein PC113_g23413 [Phytophthora cactorum]